MATEAVRDIAEGVNFTARSRARSARAAPLILRSPGLQIK